MSKVTDVEVTAFCECFLILYSIGRCDRACAITCNSDGVHKFVHDGVTAKGMAMVVEENIRCWPHDPFGNRVNTLVHEFGHLIHQKGFTQQESDQVCGLY